MPFLPHFFQVLLFFFFSPQPPIYFFPLRSVCVLRPQNKSLSKQGVIKIKRQDISLFRRKQEKEGGRKLTLLDVFSEGAGNEGEIYSSLTRKSRRRRRRRRREWRLGEARLTTIAVVCVRVCCLLAQHLFRTNNLIPFVSQPLLDRSFACLQIGISVLFDFRS